MVKYQRDKVLKIVGEMKSALSLLRELGGMTREEFAGDAHRKSSAKYNFIVAIEGMVDLCNHLISQNDFRVPDDYANAISLFFEQAGDNAELRDSLIRAVRFRNRLVHIYWEVGDDDLHAILKTGPAEITRFLQVLSGYLGMDQ